MKRLAILGSTGSIGTQTLEVVRANEGDFEVLSLTANNNVELLLEQAKEFRPELVCIFDKKLAKENEHRFRGISKVVSGIEGLIECAVIDNADMVVGAVVGMIGVRPIIEAVNAGKDIALANKETLVTAGHIIMPLAKKKNVRILPVDSEHSAIFQSLNGENRKQIDKLILTASGGPFRGMNKEELKKVTLEDALKHPNWSMGKKITIDSATMVNKGLEIMEASWLFDVDIDDIQVVIQPQSVIHSMVEFIDGAVIAQLGTPDMRLPIQYALYYPDRVWLNGERLNFYELGHIDFTKPDYNTFEGLSLAIQAAKIGGSMPTVYNAANEYAVAKFIAGQIGFTDITAIIRNMMENHNVVSDPDVDTIIEIEQEIYKQIG
ncbi:MAG: 1-deoxy-D-xylulose-5-phosphate reductoisomerase [Lachnospiraceae bacterium]|nr:1-deoxy-D-xylulose-5-phosphate reductoisomerase [Lachnospiraceae bacterium]